MMSYQQLDFIADSYIPLLLFIVLVALIRNAIASGIVTAYKKGIPFAVGVIFIYALMFIDNQLKIWHAFTLDYSTHTALALVFVCGRSFWGKKQFVVAICSMVFYCILMVYQEYHTVLDIISTGAAVIPVLFWLNIKLKPATIS